MTYLKITNEYAKLRRVILGSPASFGNTPRIDEAYDPKSREHIQNGTYPVQQDVTAEMTGFSEVLLENGVEVIRPDTIEDYNQIFSRDIGCVIEGKFIIANMIEDREREINAINSFIDSIDDKDIIKAPEEVRFEGGDIIPHNDYIFVGHSKPKDFSKYIVSRTNEDGVKFLAETFPDKIIKSFELNKSDDDACKNALHLDCCFQPLGLGHAILHENGFKNKEEFQWLVDFFGKENCLFIDETQMYNMGANLFSIAPNHIVSEVGFTEVNNFLESKGYKVSKIKYSEIAKMEGLLRCSTLPLLREE